MASGERAELPPFSGDDPVCVKCGFVGAQTAWAPVRLVSDLGPGGELRWEPECLRRSCRRCGFGWNEATVASAEVSSEEPR